MSDRPARPPILPSSASAFQRAIADTDGRLDDIDMDRIRRAKVVGAGHNGGPPLEDDERAEAPFLPYLAWEVSVDVWDPAWPEEIKRDVIAAAPIVHRYKGTRGAVRRALEALKVGSEIVEWWQTSPRGAPYTFHVRAYAGAKLYDGAAVLDDRLLRAIRASVMAVKPLSRAFSLSIGGLFRRRLGAAAIATAVVKPRNAMRPITRERRNLGLAGVAVGAVKVRAAMLLEAA